ncbi:hypothetical protein NP493_242g01009 [Ridgeia piscesae]|uniref:Uncharacterized protein n=1 Tax=Ridgeia piscesae TaxID=27915 RepID=A0AAD9NYU1_RIDPI|nr:hypothetical protein NP493_242g01009 [Ridgeia piscesae]
MMVALTLRYKV